LGDELDFQRRAAKQSEVESLRSRSSQFPFQSEYTDVFVLCVCADINVRAVVPANSKRSLERSRQVPGDVHRNELHHLHHSDIPHHAAMGTMQYSPSRWRFASAAIVDEALFADYGHVDALILFDVPLLAESLRGAHDVRRPRVLPGLVERHVFRRLVAQMEPTGA